MKKIKLCVIGAGDHARRFIYPSLNTISDLEIVAVCTRTAATAQAAARKYGIPRAYTNYREMLEKENPDGTVIVGPPSLHCQAGMACIERKIPFFCEKPSASDAAGAETLAAAARNAGVFGQVGFMMRHAAFFRELEKIRATAGDPVYGTVNYLTSGPYRHDVIYGMLGVEDGAFLHRYLLVQAVHPVNFATALLGRIRSIDSYVRFSGAEDLVVEILLEDHDNRRFRVLLHTLVAPGYGNLRFQSELFFADRTMLFTDGFDRLEWNLPDPSQNASLRGWRFAPFGDNNERMGYLGELRFFCDALRSGAPADSRTSLDDCAETMRILAVVQQQFEERRAARK